MPLGIAAFVIAWVAISIVTVPNCPYCGKMVKLGRSSCHHCGRFVD